jgi:hypothetical protein
MMEIIMQNSMMMIMKKKIKIIMKIMMTMTQTNKRIIKQKNY